MPFFKPCLGVCALVVDACDSLGRGIFKTGKKLGFPTLGRLLARVPRFYALFTPFCAFGRNFSHDTIGAKIPLSGPVRHSAGRTPTLRH